MSLNKVMLIGNVGQDPEVRYLDGGSGSNTKVASFSVATSERYRDRVGEMHEITEWHSVVAWRGLADVVERFVKKGTQVFIEGRLRTRSWEDQNHNRRYTTEVVADNMQLLGRRQDGQGQQGGYQGRQGGYQQGGYQQNQSGYQHGGYQQGGYQQQSQQNQQNQASYQSQPASQPQVPPASEEDDDLPF